MMKLIYALPTLYISIGLLSACKAAVDVKTVPPAAEVVTETQTAPDAKPKEPAATTKPSTPSPENNYGYETVAEMEAMQGLSLIHI